MSKRPAKIEDVMAAVKAALAAGTVRVSEHAEIRFQERDIAFAEAAQVLMKGFHEAKKDQFDELHGAWNYAIRGKTGEGRALRVVIVVVAPNVLIVTAIDLDTE